MIEQEYSVSHRHWPQGGIRHIGPVDAGVEQHSPADGHNRLNCSLRDTIVVVCADSSVSVHLPKGLQMGLKLLRGKS